MKQSRPFLLLFSLFLLSFSHSHTQNVDPDLYWEYIHDLPNSGFYHSSKLEDMVVFGDGSTIGVGTSRKTVGSSFNSSILVDKVDPFGNTLWSLNLLDSTTTKPKIAAWGEDHVVIAEEYGNILIVSNNGTLVWNDTLPVHQVSSPWFGGSYVRDVMTDQNKRTVVAVDRYLSSPTSIQKFPRIVVFDSTHNFVLDTSYTNVPGLFEFYEIQETNDGSYLLVGYLTLQGLTVPYMIKIDPLGEIVWQRQVADIHNTNSRIVRVFEDGTGDLFMVGSGWMTGYATEQQTYMIHFDSNGDSLWTRSIGDSLPFWDVTQDATGDFYALGWVVGSFNTHRIYKIDTSANLIWNQDFQISSFITNAARILGTSNGISIAGHVQEPNRGFLTHLDTNGVMHTNWVTGKVFLDSAANCIPDSGEPFLTQTMIKMEPGPVYTMTNLAAGEYQLEPDSGDYWISLPNTPNLWDISCPSNPDSHFVSFSGIYDTLSNVNFALEPAYLCPYLEVSFSTFRLRHCKEHTYIGRVHNWGTQTAVNAYVEVDLDTLMTVLSPPPNTVSLGGNRYRVNLGDIGIWQTKHFAFDIQVSCDPVIGRTACTKAVAYPSDYCEAPHPAWDSASIEVTGSCIPGDSVEFIITNVGTGNMAAATGILIAEDDILKISGSVQLNAGQDTTITIEGNGSTWKCMVDQVPFHPGQSFPRATVEACGVNSFGLYSTGYVGTTIIDDLDHFRDIDYQMIFGSCDPNDKTGFPLGTGDHHLINATDVLDYRIRFQNTGNDTAFKVVIRDQLPPELDLGTIQLGVSSHPYTFEILPNNTIEWTFSPIALPDSFVDEPGSNGFVNFTISQTPGNQPGDVIRNAAEIYFDFNPAVVTDTSWHTIADSTMPSALVYLESAVEGLDLEVYPNPFQDHLTIRIPRGNYRDLQFELFDLQGKLIHKQTSPFPDRIIYHRRSLPVGAYVFYLRDKTKMLGTGKLIAN